ncbi:YlxR family protein [Acidipropionibacterium jensenii]|uniref:YlxR family protein n=1 Tax=Acidipropionibacterium jensenii TaxID=1749 RepID=UPI002649626D|nr:YlxR family protein [Acidipropionibacterium jensenii]
MGCRLTGDPATMVRFVLSGDAGTGWLVRLDPTSAAPGRGAHLHPDRRCWQAATRGGFARSFRRRLRVEAPDRPWAAGD